MKPVWGTVENIVDTSIFSFSQRTYSFSRIDCMLFNAIFNSISIISQRPVHLFMLSWSSFNQYSAQYSFQATGCFATKPMSKQQTAVREEWILSQWLSSILGKNIGQASDLFSSLQCYWLSYRARLIFKDCMIVWYRYVQFVFKVIEWWVECNIMYLWQPTV